MRDKEGLFKTTKIKFMNLIKKLFGGRKKVIGLIILLAATGWFGWRTFTAKDKKPRYQTITVKRGMIISSVSASGRVLSANIISASTKASGIIKKVYVRNGDEVKKGDKILEIDLDLQGKQKNAQAWSSYLSAKNSLETAKANLYSLNSSMWAANQKFINDAVARDLAENDPTYIQQHDDWSAAEARYKNQKTVVAQAQAALNNAWLNYQLSSPIIRSPATGIITNLSVVEGIVINGSSDGNTSQKIAVVKKGSTILAKFNLSEIDVSKVIVGQKAIIVLDSIPDKTFTGKVASVDKIGAVTSGVSQYPAIIQFDTQAIKILPNMAVTANIVIDRKDNVLLVPSGVIQNKGDQSYVSVLVDGKSQFVPVETGLSSDTQTEIVSGLNEGDLVITGSISSAGSQPNGTSPFKKGVGGMMKMAR